MSQRPVRWAARLPHAKIVRLYQTDARGIVDENLIEDVGIGLFARCISILRVTDAMAGQVHCPHCDTIIVRTGDDPDEVLSCPRSDWQALWRNYYVTFRHQELYGGGAVEMFAAFVQDWPCATDPRRKMLLIDRLIHAWHWQNRDDHIIGRPTGVNLIEGNRASVIALLNNLTHSTSSTPGIAENEAQWRALHDQVRQQDRDD